MRNFIDFLLSEAKLGLGPGEKDVGEMVKKGGELDPKAKGVIPELSWAARLAGGMLKKQFNSMMDYKFGPPSGDVKEPSSIVRSLKKKVKEKKEKKKPSKPISSFFDHTAEGAEGKLPKKIAASVNDHLARLHAAFFSDNKRRPTQQEAAKMAHEVVDDHFAGIQRTLKKTKLTSKSGKPVKITHFQSMREDPNSHYGPWGQAMGQVDDSGPMPNGRHLVVHVDHHHTGIYNINNDHAHARHIAAQLKAQTGHDWYHVPYSEGVKIRGKKVVFRGNKSSPMMFATSMTHRDIDRGDAEGGGGDDDGGPDEPTPIAPRGPRTRQPQLV